MRARRVLRWVVLTVLAVLLPPAGYVGWVLSNDNLGALEPGRVYRSRQMSPGRLSGTIRGRRIKTVLNLRGANPRQPWYRAERAATTGAGATQVDVSMSSSEWMSRVQLRAVVRVLDTCEYPLLIHCEWGAERTGWVSAVATLLRPGATLDDARRQFSIDYLYLPLGDGRVMAEHLARYEGWLAADHRSHTASRFREWVGGGYTPGSPGREEWPYDPYPLVSVTRPAPAAPAAVARAGVAAVER